MPVEFAGSAEKSGANEFFGWSFWCCPCGLTFSFLELAWQMKPFPGTWLTPVGRRNDRPF
ncbi:MAG TPA: hypothetical protein VJO35_09675 [Terriglobales bacterium]|nr:hypothetical protein [Terriglobales bacterium]